MSLDLGIYPDACDTSAETQRIAIKNLSSSTVGLTEYPDRIWVELSSSGWTLACDDPEPEPVGGCPTPLPPGTACAIVGELNATVMTALDQGNETYSRIRVGWSSGYHDEITVRMPSVCSM